MTIAPTQPTPAGAAGPRLDAQAVAAPLAVAAARLAALTAMPVTPMTAAGSGGEVDDAVRSAAQRAVVRQGGLAPLLADLEQAARAPDLPAPVRAAIDQILALRTRTDPPPTAAEFKQALSRSGLFLEARLAAEPPGRGAPAAGPPDLKAALLVFRQVLNAWVGPSVDRSPAAQPAPPAAAAEAAAVPRPSPSPGVIASAVPPSAAAPPASSAAQPPAPPVAAGTGSPPPVSAPVQPGQDLPTASAPAPASSVAAGAGAAPPSAEEGLAQPAHGQAVRPSAAGGTSPAVLHDAAKAAAEPSTRQVPRPPLASEPPGEPPRARPAEEAVPARPPTRNDADARPRASGLSADTPPPPYRQGPTSAQPPAVSHLPEHAEPAVVGRLLLRETDAAIARQELHQIASLPLASDAVRANGADGAKWMFEIPFATAQGAAVAQFEISRDGGGGSGARHSEAPTWSARFSFDLEPMGPIHAQVTLTGARAGVTLWAERPATVARLRDREEALSAALRQAEFAPEVLVRPGLPGGTPSPGPGHFLDKAT